MKFLAKIAVVPLLFMVISACSGKKPANKLYSEDLVGKTVAIAQIDAAKESRAHVEVAIINEVIDQGRFEVLDRTTVLDALSTYPDRSDWKRLGDFLKSDFILGVKVVDFTVKERQGYDTIEEDDSLLTEESGSSKTVRGKRHVKVKGNAGKVRLKLTFFDVAQDKVLHEGFGEASETVNSRDNPEGGKMALLERLTAMAVRNFFEALPRD